jgi:hypothetical protein
MKAKIPADTATGIYTVAEKTKLIVPLGDIDTPESSSILKTLEECGHGATRYPSRFRPFTARKGFVSKLKGQ